MREPVKKLGVLLLLVVGLLTARAGWSMAQEAGQGEAPEPPAVKVPLVIPEADKNRENPYRGSAESIDNGKTLFQTQCTMCHGVRGDGKGDLVERLKLEVPDFTDPATQSKRTDGELFYILTHGHGEMQGEDGRLSDEWKWDLVNYIRTLARPALARP